jgi:hypothetical protein
MTGLNLLVVGAMAEAHLGDTSAPAASLSEGIDFAGVLATVLPADESPTPDEAAMPDAPNTNPQLTPLATLGLTTLPILPVLEPTVAADHTAQTHEPSLRAARDTGILAPELPPLLEPVVAGADAPEPTTVLGDKMGQSDLVDAQPAASESLLAVEGDALPVPARQAALPPPPPSTVALTDTSALGALSTVPTQDAPLRDDLAPTPEPLHPREEPPTPAPAHEPRTHAPTPHAPSPTHEPTLSATDAAAPAEPNWNAAEQVAQHIERMVYERERNRLTVRLDPPEVGIVELRVQAMGSEVQAWLTAERDLTRQMLQQAQQYLREQLESRGLHLTHFDVGAQSQFQHAPREQYTRYAAQTVSTRTPTATDSLLYDGRWSVWV